MPGAREDWFSTSVWYFDHPDAATVNEGLLRGIATERQADGQGIPERSNALGWQSRHDLHLREGFGELVSFMEACVAEVVRFQHWDLSQVAPRMAGCWAIVNGPGASNAVHNHPNCYLSGIYYVQAPEGCGDIFFLDPRAAAVMMPLPMTQLTTGTFARVVYRPLPGRLLIFPSWLYHGVEPNRSGQERVGISFNVAVRWLAPAG